MLWTCLTNLKTNFTICPFPELLVFKMHAFPEDSIPISSWKLPSPLKGTRDSQEISDHVLWCKIKMPFQVHVVFNIMQNPSPEGIHEDDIQSTQCKLSQTNQVLFCHTS